MQIFQIYLFDLVTKSRSHSGIEVEADNYIQAEQLAQEYLGLDSVLCLDAILGEFQPEDTNLETLTPEIKDFGEFSGESS
jgi:hypothetical protein